MLTSPEIVINEHINFSEKLKYFQNLYDNNLKHKYTKNAKIIDFKSFNTFSELKNW